MVKFYQEIKVDLNAERKRINRCGYSRKEKKALLKLVDLIEEGQLDAAVSFVRTWSREWLEYIGCDVSDLITSYGRVIVIHAFECGGIDTNRKK